MFETQLVWYAQTDGGVAEGSVAAGPDADVVRVRAELPEGVLGAVTARMAWPLAEGEVVWMNGYQTWTASPELGRYGRLRGVDRLPRAVLERYAFDRYGDYHFVRYGHHAGQSHGFSYCYFRRGDRVRLVASLDERPGYTVIRYDARANAGTGMLSFERDCAGVGHAGGSFAAFDLFFAEGTADEVFDAWFARMAALGTLPGAGRAAAGSVPSAAGPAPSDGPGAAGPTRRAPKIAGYSSWYNRYQDIDEAAILSDLEGCRKLFRPGDLFQVDDGWEPKVGDWLEADAAKFPHGLAPLVGKVHDAGLKAGLWLAPFVCERDSALFAEHPDWLLRVPGGARPAGRGELAGVALDSYPVRRAAGLSYGDPWRLGCNWSGFYALDTDNPEVVAYIRRVFDRVLNDWGFDLVKLDFLYGAAPFGTRDASRAERMTRAMELLRECCADRLILGCGVPVFPAFGLVDYCRVGCDVTLDWDDVWYMRAFHRERSSTRQSIVNTLTRRALDGRAYGSDPDVFFLRDKNLRLAPAQKDALATLDALLGSVLLTSDDPSGYTPAMRERYRELRELFEHAEDLRVDLDARRVSWRLHGALRSLELAL